METPQPDNNLKGSPARYWHMLEDGRIQCDLCPRFCKLRQGQRGLCFVRGRQGDKLVLTTYGRSSGFCVDPIEKKPLNHFLPGTPVLSFGTAGCNLTCKFCQNWDISKARVFDRLQDRASPEDIVRMAQDTGSRSVAFTYNDPVIFLEYAVDVATACREAGIRPVAVTAGYITEQPREEFFAAMDAANVDLKAFTEGFYKTLCSVELAPVLETLKYLKHATDVWFEITTLLIPGHNDSAREITALSEWVMDNLGPSVPLHFSRFHPDWKMRDIPSTPSSTLQDARDIALK
ncbi:MAG: AmmeMemoRadiSam system radical SAM enzyme, partial [Hyphomicrobiales bacterium]|nr:AmmeMemoRadiSam system radical SAM enzyme [Hyphomicrobiales bacterium]